MSTKRYDVHIRGDCGARGCNPFPDAFESESGIWVDYNDYARIVEHLRAEATRHVLVYTARGHAAGVKFALDAVQRQAEQYLYTNTKNGNREAMLNIVKRLRAELGRPCTTTGE